MATFTTTAPRLAGLTVALPSSNEENSSLAFQFGEQAMSDIIRTTGIDRRPIAKTETISDLGQLAASHLLERLGWSASSIDAIVVVTQTPDHPLPATACLLQNGLGLEKSTLAFDVNLGCSGYVYGLSIVNGLMQTAGLRRVLLVCGDMTSRMIDPHDRSLRPLFGDAVAVTALETHGSQLSIDLGTDGAGAPYLISQNGGLCNAGPARLFMDGVQVMAFSLKRVAPSVAATLNAAGLRISDVDAVVFHQANAMVLKNLGRKIGATPEQLVLAVQNYGNTSSASIPLALCDWLGRPDFEDHSTNLRLLLSGFGVGWSWGTALWSTPRPEVADLIRFP
jgi:3-oxoacyl-[acyl-carrier-protein] synthase III